MGIKIHTDGATRPTNPGPSGYGVVISNDVLEGETIEICGYVGDNVTNNQAEYLAVIVGLDAILSLAGGVLSGTTVEIISDSQLVIEQLSGRWALKSAKLHGLYQKAMSLVEDLHQIGIEIKLTQVKGHSGIPGNEKADELAGKAVIERIPCPKWVEDLINGTKEIASKEKGHEKLEKLVLPWLNKHLTIGTISCTIQKQALHSADNTGANFIAYMPSVVGLSPTTTYLIVWTTGYQMVKNVSGVMYGVRTMDSKSYAASQLFDRHMPVKVLYIHKPHGGGRFRRLNELGWTQEVVEAPAMVSEGVHVVGEHQNPGWPIFVEIESKTGWTEVKAYFKKELEL